MLREQIAARLKLRAEQVDATVELLDAGNTLPFIARYRKEITGGLDEEQIRQLSALLSKLRKLMERRETVVAAIEKQDKMTPELRQQLMDAETLTQLEDLYQPYKPKRRTRAQTAREKGLQGLADMILEQAHPTQMLEQLAAPYLSDEVATPEEAWAGARDIVAETISDHAQVRSTARERALKRATLHAEKAKGADDPKATYQLYYGFEYPVARLRPHQVLAINRGEAEKVLRVRVEIEARDWRSVVGAVFAPDRESPLVRQLVLAAEDGAQRLLLPAIERDVRRALTEAAETHAITIFAKNLRALLGQPPLAGHTVMGIDPGFRTGCKVAVVDPTGRTLDAATIYPHEPQRQRDAARKTLTDLASRHGVTLIAIGNGTASRETEVLVADLISSPQSPVSSLHYLLASEAGASVYSASKLARAELPDMDVSMRGAVSIARRVQDPLAELVKIDPKSIGVGMYQHDVNQTELAGALDGVVESVVNQVGVDLNTASPALLTHVAGVGPKLALAILATLPPGPLQHAVLAEDAGALTEVPGVGKKTAQRLILDLRSRLELPDAELAPSTPIAEVREALEGLGYQGAEVREALSGLEEDTVEALLKAALQRLGRA